MPQGIGADLIATLGGWGREDVDAFALTSQQRAAAAQAEGRFDRSVIRWTTRSACRCSSATNSSSRAPRWKAWRGKAGVRRSRRDGLRCGGAGALSAGRAHRARAHAGNSSGIVDGAAAVLIGSEAGARTGLTPRGRIVATALSGADPTIMLTGPMPATRKALAKAG